MEQPDRWGKAEISCYSFGDWTATGNDKETRTCSVCGHTETRDAGNQGGGTGGNQGGGEDINEELISKFNSYVSTAKSATMMTDKFNAIKSALTVYNQMTDAEQNLVTDAYADLEEAIVSYNNAATVVNNESNKATENAIMLFAGTFSVLAFAAYFLLRR